MSPRKTAETQAWAAGWRGEDLGAAPDHGTSEGGGGSEERSRGGGSKSTFCGAIPLRMGKG